jgi:hypothetical protein
VGLAERVDPANAPHGVNDSERLLFRQLYETLVRVDCEGHAHAGLAASWRLDESRPRTWVVTLRDGARFADGTPVTPAEVVSAWTGGSGALIARVGRAIESIASLDDRTLAITLRRVGDGSPRELADTRLAIARSVAGSPWPLGTRGLRTMIEGTAGAGGRMVITLVASSGSAPAAAAGSAAPLRFLVAEGLDRRDFLDEGVDLVATRDPAALAYAATLPQFVPLPLAWHRTHVFVSPWRGPSLPRPSPDIGQALARDGVRGEARGAEGPFWWGRPGDCGVEGPPQQPEPAGARARVVYEDGDEASRDLAERLVGLARGGKPGAGGILDALTQPAPGRTFQRAEALRPGELATSLQRGSDAGYILSFDRVPLDPCQALLEIVERLPWLDPAAIVPLIDTRPWAILRRGRAGLFVEGDGGLLITRAGIER